MADSPDVSALQAYAGKYRKQLVTQMVTGFKFSRDMMALYGVRENLTMPKLSVADGVRPFSSEEEFLGDEVSFTDRVLRPGKGKRELKIDANKYFQTYLNEVVANGLEGKRPIPYEQSTWNAVVQKIRDEINTKTAFSGFDKSDATAYSEAATYAADDYVTYSINDITHYYKCLTATTAGQDPEDTPAKWKRVNAEAVAKGVGTIIAEEIAASNLSAQSIGAITSGAEALAGFKELYRSFDAVYKENGQRIVINCSHTDFEFLTDGMVEHAKYTQKDIDTRMESEMTLVVPGTGGLCLAKPASWLGTSRRLIAGPAAKVAGSWRNTNLFFGTNIMADFNNIETVKSELWKLKAGITFILGFQIADLEALKVGDQS